MSERQVGGVVRIRLVDTNPRGEPRPRWWEARYEDRDGNGGHTQGPEKSSVLRWAAQQPALEWLMQDPATGEWSPWEPVTADTCEIKVLRIPPLPCPPDTVDDGHHSSERWAAWWVCGEMSGIVESHDKEYVLAWVRARMAPATVDGLSEAQDSEDSSAAADPASEPSGNGCDHHGENAMDDDEGKAREALAAGRTDEAIAHTLLDMRDTLHHMWWSTAQLNHSFNTWMRALADREGRAVTLIHRDSADPRTWHAQWNAGTSGGSKSWMGEGKEDAMRWAAELPAGVRLILDPDTNKWMPWEDADRYVERPF